MLDREESGAELARAQHEARSWRAVAQEREQALEELDRVNQWLEAQNGNLAEALEELRQQQGRLRQQVGELSGQNQELAGQLERAAAELRQTGALLQALGRSLRARLARRLKALFPSGSLHGRAVRRGVRLARRLFRRSA